MSEASEEWATVFAELAPEERVKAMLEIMLYGSVYVKDGKVLPGYDRAKDCAGGCK